MANIIVQMSDTRVMTAVPYVGDISKVSGLPRYDPKSDYMELWVDGSLHSGYKWEQSPYGWKNNEI